MAITRRQVVDQAISWLGIEEGTKAHHDIIDVYNNYYTANPPFPDGYVMKYSDAWCCAFVTACFIKSNAISLINGGCTCQNMIEANPTIWQEEDYYVPKKGDIIMFALDTTTKGETTDRANHTGIVEYVSGNEIHTIEGNHGDKVARVVRTVNQREIRGFITPAFDSEDDDDLTNTTWLWSCTSSSSTHGPIVAPAGTGLTQFNVTGTITQQDGSTLEFKRLNIGYFKSTPYADAINVSSSAGSITHAIVHLGWPWYSSITITGGADVKNTSLKGYLELYATRKRTLFTLPDLSVGNHTIKAVAIAPGYSYSDDSVAKTASNYSITASLSPSGKITADSNNPKKLYGGGQAILTYTTEKGYNLPSNYSALGVTNCKISRWYVSDVYTITPTLGDGLYKMSGPDEYVAEDFDGSTNSAAILTFGVNKTGYDVPITAPVVYGATSQYLRFESDHTCSVVLSDFYDDVTFSLSPSTGNYCITLSNRDNYYLDKSRYSVDGGSTWINFPTPEQGNISVYCSQIRFWSSETDIAITARINGAAYSILGEKSPNYTLTNDGFAQTFVTS